jgi:hypothetical protein
MTQPQEQDQDEQLEPLPEEPSHVMTREHYERMAREAQDQQK